MVLRWKRAGGVENILVENVTPVNGRTVLALDGQGRSGSGGDIFIAAPTHPSLSQSLTCRPGRIWNQGVPPAALPPIDGTKYNCTDNGRGLKERLSSSNLCYCRWERQWCGETIAPFNLSERAQCLKRLLAWIRRKARLVLYQHCCCSALWEQHCGCCRAVPADRQHNSNCSGQPCAATIWVSVGPACYIQNPSIPLQGTASRTSHIQNLTLVLHINTRLQSLFPYLSHLCVSFFEADSCVTVYQIS